MKNRIKKIRTDSGLSMEKFGERIGITRSSVCKLESGENNPSEQTLKLICKEFGINKEWLADGTPPMRPPDKLSTYLGQIDNGNDEFIKDLIVAYMELDPDSKKALQVLTEKMYEERKERGQ